MLRTKEIVTKEHGTYEFCIVGETGRGGSLTREEKLGFRFWGFSKVNRGGYDGVREEYDASDKTKSEVEIHCVARRLCPCDNCVMRYRLGKPIGLCM